jgi:hypothetical protein
MTTIPLDQGGEHLIDVLQRQPLQEPILLTHAAAPVGLILKLPGGVAQAEDVIWLDDQEGGVHAVIQLSTNAGQATEGIAAKPVFGSCQGMLQVLAEDDEHLQDFAEYMQ